MCLSSALQVQMVSSMKDHPALSLIPSILSYYEENGHGADDDFISSLSSRLSSNDAAQSPPPPITTITPTTTPPHPVFICTDDPLMFHTTLTQECQFTADILGLSLVQIEILQNLARTHAFIHYSGDTHTLICETRLHREFIRDEIIT